MEKPEEHRNKWAFGLAVVFSIFIFTGFAFYRGFLSLNINIGKTSAQVANVVSVVSAKSVPSPIETSKETFSAAFSEIGKQYQSFKDSMEAVFVPFVSGIDVYQRK